MNTHILYILYLLVLTSYTEKKTQFYFFMKLLSKFFSKLILAKLERRVY